MIRFMLYARQPMNFKVGVKIQMHVFANKEICYERLDAKSPYA